MRKLFLALCFVPAFASAQVTIIPNPPPPTMRLAWNHDGVGVTLWKVKVDQEEKDVTAARAADGIWETPLPEVPVGTHNIFVAACNEHGCGWSLPLAVGVQPSSPSGLSVREAKPNE